MSLLTLTVCGILLVQYIQCTDLKCEGYITPNNIQLIIDYNEWKSLRHIVILEENIKLGCNLKLLKKSMDKFTYRNMYLSIHSSINATEHFLHTVKFKASIITFYRNQSKEDFQEQANKITFYGEKVAWLIILLSGEENILEYLRLVNFGLDADVILATGMMWTRPETHHQIRKKDVSNMQHNNTITENEYNFTEEERKEEVNTFTPFLDNNNNSASYKLENFCPKINTSSVNAYCMLQIYKIRKFNSRSLVVYSLGIWTFDDGTAAMNPFLNTERRDNLYQFPLIFGEKKCDPLSNENVIEDDDDETDIEQFAEYFCSLLNASEKMVSFSKLGDTNNNGEWTDLFGAIIQENIDMGLDTIIKTPRRSDDMAFTHNIMESKRNIYIQPQESNELRDIFLVPFDSRLIQCVVGIGGILAIVMTIFKKMMRKFHFMDIRNKDTGLFDSIMWSIGIFGQQGSIWKPRSSAEQIIIIVSLAFTLVIYNSYSAFITSVLSIKLTDIRTVDDLLNSDYEIGYAKNSQDEIYLRSMNITQLNEIYLRGYLHNNINNVTEGLLKAARGNYGFFASSHVARRELLIISNYKCKYDIAEIPIKDTVNYIAFPMSKRSPYRRLINLSIIKMFESGVYKHIYPLLYPELQKCEKPITYQSARLPDLTTAFAVLVLGIIFSIIVIIMECLWKRKRSIYSSFRKNMLQQKPTHNQFSKEATVVKNF